MYVFILNMTFARLSQCHVILLHLYLELKKLDHYRKCYTKKSKLIFFQLGKDVNGLSDYTKFLQIVMHNGK